MTPDSSFVWEHKLAAGLTARDPKSIGDLDVPNALSPVKQTSPLQIL
jgi:hypothetical protein